MKTIIASIPVGRLDRGDDIARMAVFLSPDEIDFTTGATFSLNGGR